MEDCNLVNENSEFHCIQDIMNKMLAGLDDQVQHTDKVGVHAKSCLALSKYHSDQHLYWNYTESVPHSMDATEILDTGLTEEQNNVILADHQETVCRVNLAANLFSCSTASSHDKTNKIPSNDKTDDINSNFQEKNCATDSEIDITGDFVSFNSIKNDDKELDVMVEDTIKNDHISLSCPVFQNAENDLLTDSEKSFLIFLDDMRGLTTKEKSSHKEFQTDKNLTQLQTHWNSFSWRSQRCGKLYFPLESLCPQVSESSADDLQITAVVNQTGNSFASESFDSGSGFLRNNIIIKMSNETSCLEKNDERVRLSVSGKMDSLAADNKETILNEEKENNLVKIRESSQIQRYECSPERNVFTNNRDNFISSNQDVLLLSRQDLEEEKTEHGIFNSYLADQYSQVSDEINTVADDNKNSVLYLSTNERIPDSPGLIFCDEQCNIGQLLEQSHKHFEYDCKTSTTEFANCKIVCHEHSDSPSKTQYLNKDTRKDQYSYGIESKVKGKSDKQIDDYFSANEQHVFKENKRHRQNLENEISTYLEAAGDNPKNISEGTLTDLSQPKIMQRVGLCQLSESSTEKWQNTGKTNLTAEPFGKRKLITIRQQDCLVQTEDHCNRKSKMDLQLHGDLIPTEPPGMCELNQDTTFYSDVQEVPTMGINLEVVGDEFSKSFFAQNLTIKPEQLCSTLVEKPAWSFAEQLSSVDGFLVPDQTINLREDSLTAVEDSLYTSNRKKQGANNYSAPSNFKWKYRHSCDSDDENLSIPSEVVEPVLGNIQPLLTTPCYRTLRLGLSRKQKVKRLHKNMPT